MNELTKKLAPSKHVGVKRKLTTDFVEALANDFAEHGPSVIRQVRAEAPVQYLTIISKLLPREDKVEHNVTMDFANYLEQSQTKYIEGEIEIDDGPGNKNSGVEEQPA